MNSIIKLLTVCLMLTVSGFGCGDDSSQHHAGLTAFDTQACEQELAAEGVQLLKEGKPALVSADDFLVRMGLCVPAGAGFQIETGTGYPGCNADTMVFVHEGEGESSVASDDNGGTGECSLTEVVGGPGKFYVDVMVFGGEGSTQVLASLVDCTPTDEVACKEGDAYLMNSCGGPHEMYEACGASEACVSGECESCDPHDYQGCSGGDVHWFNSCGIAEALVETCGSSEKCSGGNCVPDAPPCNKHCSCSCPCGTATIDAISGCLGSCYSECNETCDDMCYGYW